ncbi:LacI family DNA-binding transcriptional regulator [Litorihabitans aurantiacus]|uniref:LacI family transcriptional regulator n=1 Tax=Litorihabitans aurantiacus TaxID=1930061 RepID=A0AA37XCU5_9MICO|nr:LacI family DNA-binding transcriptional regulator [Litorihabitans aurantiacus]GMA30300.1 LacI family transcriptional regulator [Litorihabitans aurantiacus]
MRDRTTLSDVAREAGVSLATASRAINGSADRSVRPELVARVRAAAEALHYSPDATAQAMARGRTTTLGLLVHDIADPYFSAIASAVVRTAEAEGLQVSLATTQNDPAREAALLDLVRRQRARAVVIAGGRSAGADAERDGADPASSALTDALTALARQGVGVAAIGQPVPGVASVAVDNAGGAAALADALLGRGYRRFALLDGPADRVTARDRRDAFEAAARAGGGDVVARERTPFTWEGGHEGLDRLADAGVLAEVDAVVATNDVMALGALAAARARDLSVPGDLALAGFGGISTLRDVVPGLTTVAVPMEELGVRAVRLALGDPATTRDVVEQVGCDVVLRDSTPPLD